MSPEAQEVAELGELEQSMAKVDKATAKLVAQMKSVEAKILALNQYGSPPVVIGVGTMTRKELARKFVQQTGEIAKLNRVVENHRRKKSGVQINAAIQKCERHLNTHRVMCDCLHEEWCKRVEAMELLEATPPEIRDLFIEVNDGEGPPFEVGS